MSNALLTIAIPSYNRPIELERCLASIEMINQTELIEVLIVDDDSMNRDPISEVVNRYQGISPYKIRFHKNGKNLGFDKNISKLIEISSTKYVMLMSDDDAFIAGGLQSVIDALFNSNVGMLFTSFIDQSRSLILRNHKLTLNISAGRSSINKYIYDSIMFSGLVFRRDLLVNLNYIDSIKNYIQVYYFLFLMNHYESIYLNSPLFYAFGDGENGFGKNLIESNDRLANRDGLYSNIEFHKGLISTIRTYDREFNQTIISSFRLHYQIRTLTKLIQAKRGGTKELFNYFKEIKNLGLGLNIIPLIYIVTIMVLGSRLSSWLYNIVLEKLLKKAN